MCSAAGYCGVICLTLQACAINQIKNVYLSAGNCVMHKIKSFIPHLKYFSETETVVCTEHFTHTHTRPI